MDGGRQDTIGFYIYKNEVAVPSIYIQNRIEGLNDVGAATLMGSVELSTGDYVELWVENQSSSDNVTINNMNLMIH